MSTELSTELSEENKEFIKDTSVFIENTNLESMKMIKEGILVAINELTLYKEDSKNTLYLEHKDVMKAIEEGFDNQVAVYKNLQKGTFASGDSDNFKKLRTMSEEIWEATAKARATPLPSNKSLKNGFSYNNNNNNNNNNNSNNNSNSNNKNGGMYSSRKLKKSRKPKHK